jgi:adenylate kinase family enzyme
MHSSPPSPQRIVVVGSTGSGKSTLARRLASLLDLVYWELDSLYWEPNWISTSEEIFQARVAHVVGQERWVVDGNYSRLRDLIWPRADCIVWLDYSLPVVLARLVRRTVRRVVTRESCCNGNHETLRRALSRDSVVLWALQTYARRRRDYPQQLAAQEARGATVIVHRTPAQTEAWIARLVTEQPRPTSRHAVTAVTRTGLTAAGEPITHHDGAR